VPVWVSAPQVHIRVSNIDFDKNKWGGVALLISNVKFQMAKFLPTWGFKSPAMMALKLLCTNLNNTSLNDCVL